MMRTIFTLVTVAGGRIGATSFWAMTEALDCAASWAETHFDYERTGSEENLDPIRSHLEVCAMGGEPLALIEVIEDEISVAPASHPLETRESASRPGDVFCEDGAWFVVVDVDPLECDGPMSEGEAREHAAEFGDG